MRVLVVGAIQGGTVPISRTMDRAFREIGLESDCLDYSAFQAEFLKTRQAADQDAMGRFFLNLKIHLLEEITRFRPEMIFGIAQSPLNDPEILAQLKKSGIRLCYWFMEDCRIFTYWKNIAPYFDYFFIIQKDPFAAQLAEIGCRRPYYLPVAFDPFCARDPGPSEEDIPVSFVGAPYPNRVHFFEGYREHDFRIYGEGWDRYGGRDLAIHTGERRLSEEECLHLYRRTVINLNLHSSAYPGDFVGGDFVNPRTFEIAGVGAFQLVNMRKLLTLHFDPAEEMIALGSWRDMKKAVDYFLAHPDERHDAARKARERVLTAHTYRHRAEEIMSLLV